MELEHLRATSKAAQLHSKVLQERRRNAVVLVLRFLADSNYSAAYSALSQECRLSLEQVDCADNVDLMTVIQVRPSHLLCLTLPRPLIQEDHYAFIFRCSGNAHQQALPQLMKR